MSDTTLLIKKKLKRNKKNFFLTVLALALGVALLISIQSAIQNTKKKFNDVMNKEVANADIIVQNVSNGFIEDDLSIFDEIDNIKMYYPRISIKSIAEFENSSCNINLIGGILEEEKASGSFSLKEGKIPDKNGILIPVSLYENYGLKINDTISVNLYNKIEQFVISGIINMEGMASKQYGNVCIVQLNFLQEIMATDKVSSMNIVLKNVSQRDNTLKELENKLSESSIVYFPERKNEYYLNTMKGFFLGLNIFSLISIVAGGFIIFNTTSKFVTEEKRELAILKVLGAERKKLIKYILIQNVILTTISLSIGIVIGILLTSVITNFVMQSASGVAYFSYGLISLNLLIKDILLVFGITLSASIFPALKAANVSIIDGILSIKKSEKSYNVLFVALFVLSSIILTFLLIGNNTKLNLYCLIIGVLFFSFSLLYLLISPIVKVISVFIFTGKNIYAKCMIKSNLLSSKIRTSNTIFSSGLCFALAVTIFGLSSGFKSTLSEWMNSMNPGDIVAYSRMGFDDSILNGIINSENIINFEKSYSNSVLDNNTGMQIEVASLSVSKLSSANFSKHLKCDKSIISSFENTDKIIMSEKMASDLKLNIGDIFTLSTENGRIDFTVVGMAGSILSDDNKCYISPSNFEKYYSQKKLSMIYLFVSDGVNEKMVYDSLSKEYPNVEFTYMSDEINQKKQNVSNNLFTAFYVLVFVSLIISGCCLMNSLNMFVIDQKFQISVLKCIGLTKKKLKLLMYVQGLLLGMFSVFWGIILGIILQYISLYATKIITGWEIVFKVDIINFFIVIGIGFVISIGASVLPAISSYKVSAVDELSKGDN